MKKVFSVFLVISNLFLSNSFLSLAKPTEKVTAEKVVIVESENKKEEDKKETEKQDKTEENKEKPKKNTISLEINYETIEKVKKLLNSETDGTYKKARLAIDVLLIVLLGVSVLCSIKEKFFPVTKPTPIKDVQNKTWFQSVLATTKNIFFKAADKISTALPFLVMFMYFV